jgi:hypothetical protein
MKIVTNGVFANPLANYTLKTVGSHKFIELPITTYTEIPPVPTNRNSETRVSKMRKVFDEAYAKGQSNTLTEVAIGVVLEDFEDTDSGRKYIKNQWFIVDGNTRKYYWKRYPDKAGITGQLTAKIHYFKSMEDVTFAYYPYNNAKSSEKASEILQGLARRYNWTPRQKVFANGGYKTAIDWACSYVYDKPNTFEAFNYCFEELKVLDSIPKDSSESITNPHLKPLKSQAIIASLIVALKTYNNNIRIHDMVARLSTITVEELRGAILKGELDPVQIIAAEYTGMSRDRSNTGSSKERWLGEHAGSTKFESQVPQMDFLIFWISKYIEFPKVTYNFNKGVRPTSWDGAWAECYVEDEE